MTVGFIGGGNMASAMITGLITSNTVSKENIYVSDISKTSLLKLEEKYGINTFLDNKEVARNVQVLFLAVKPNLYEMIINQIKDEISDDTIIISITPGKTLELLKSWFEKDVKIVRTMPNTPAMVLEGMTAVCKNEFFILLYLH